MDTILPIKVSFTIDPMLNLVVVVMVVVIGGIFMNIYNLGSTMYVCEYIHFRLPYVQMSQGCFRNIRKLRESGGYSEPKARTQPSSKGLLHDIF